MSVLSRFTGIFLASNLKNSHILNMITSHLRLKMFTLSNSNSGFMIWIPLPTPHCHWNLKFFDSYILNMYFGVLYYTVLQSYPFSCHGKFFPKYAFKQLPQKTNLAVFSKLTVSKVSSSSSLTRKNNSATNTDVLTSGMYGPCQMKLMPGTPWRLKKPQSFCAEVLLLGVSLKENKLICLLLKLEDILILHKLNSYALTDQKIWKMLVMQE